MTNTETKSTKAPYKSQRKPQPEGLRVADKNQFGYEKYTQSSKDHLQGAIVSLNNRFPNLTGFGVLQYLKQLMAMHPRCKVLWEDETISAICTQMNVQEKIFREVVDYCVKNLKILRFTHTWRDLRLTNEVYLIYPDFMAELIQLEIKKLREEAMIEQNEPIAGSGQKTSAQKKKRITTELKSFLILTDKMAEKVKNYYPLLGEPQALWKHFMQDVDKNYLKWNEILEPKTYADTFFIYLNNMPASEAELLNGKI